MHVLVNVNVNAPEPPPSHVTSRSPALRSNIPAVHYKLPIPAAYTLLLGYVHVYVHEHVHVREKATKKGTDTFICAAEPQI